MTRDLLALSLTPSLRSILAVRRVVCGRQPESLLSYLLNMLANRGLKFRRYGLHFVWIVAFHQLSGQRADSFFQVFQGKWLLAGRANCSKSIDPTSLRWNTYGPPTENP